MSEKRVAQILDAIKSAFGTHCEYFDIKAGQITDDDSDRLSMLVEITPRHNEHLEWEDCIVIGGPQLLVFEQEDDDDPVMILGEDTQIDITRGALYACLYWAEATCPIENANPKPTHYAVMGNGHIIHAVPADGLEGGKERCERFIDSMRDLPEAKDWTIKGVTVHE